MMRGSSLPFPLFFYSFGPSSAYSFRSLLSPARDFCLCVYVRMCRNTCMLCTAIDTEIDLYGRETICGKN